MFSTIHSRTASEKTLPDVTGKFFERLYNHKLVQDDPLNKIVCVPKDDVSVGYVERKKTTVESAVPDDIPDDSNLQDALSLMKQDWLIVRHNYRDYGLGASNVPKEFPQPEELSWQINASPTDPCDTKLIPNLIDEKGDFKMANAKLRRKNRCRLFQVYNLSGVDLQLSDKRTPGPVPLATNDVLLAVKLKEIRFDLGIIEPLFCELALFDLDKKRKISESFHFDYTTSSTRSMLVHKTSACALTQGKAALFRIPPGNANQSVVLMLRMEKIARPKTADQSAEAYFKGKGVKPKALKAIVTEITGCCNRYSYTQPFVWQVAHLFSPKGEPLRSVRFDKMVKIREKDTTSSPSLVDRMSMFFVEKEMKKLKPVPGVAHFTIDALSDPPPPSADSPGGAVATSCGGGGSIITPSLHHAPPRSSGGDDAASGEVIREMRSLCALDDSGTTAAECFPLMEYVNELFVYPCSVNLSKYSGSARNISVGVKLMPSDADPTGDGLPAIYGRAGDEALCTQVFTTITYHNKKPSFYDEIKVQIPSNLSKDHHLVFSFYHVTCQLPKKKAKFSPPEALVGHAFLPLMRNVGQVDEEVCGIIGDGEHALPVILDAPPGYLSEDVELKSIGGGRPCFSVRTHAVSSIHPQSKVLVRFFDSFRSRAAAAATRETHDVHELSGVSAQELLQFHPRMLNALLHIMCNSPDGPAQEALIATIKVVGEVNKLPKSGHPQQHPLLASYITYMLQGVPGPFPLHQQVAHLWINALADASVEQDVKDLIAKHSWFLFNVIVKSMTLHAHSSGTLRDDTARVERFPAEMRDNLKALMNYLQDWLLRLLERDARPLARLLNTYIGYFLKDLFAIEDRGYVFDLIFAYVDKLVPGAGASEHGETLMQLKFGVLKIVNDYEHFVPLNLPLPDQVKDPSNLVHRLWQKHFLVGLFLREVFRSHQERSWQLRAPGIAALRNLLIKHEFDARYTKSKYKSRVISLYFPYVLNLVSGEVNVFGHSDMAPEEKRTVLLCFLYILKNMSTETLWEWWKVETPRTLKKFFNVLKECLSTFAYDPVKAERDRLDLHAKLQAQAMGRDNTKRGGLRGRKKKAKAHLKAGEGSSITTIIAAAAPEHAGGPHSPRGGGGSSSSSSTMMMAAAGDRSSASMGGTHVPPSSSSSSSTLMVAGSRDSIDSLSSLPSVSSGGVAPSRTRQDVEKEARVALLGKEAASVVLDMLTEFTIIHQTDLNSRQPKHLESVFVVILRLFNGVNSDQFLASHLFPTVRALMQMLSKALFVRTGSMNVALCGELTHQVLRHCNFEHPGVRQLAATCLLAMMRLNFAAKEHKQFSRMKLQTTIATEKMVNASSGREDNHLRRAFMALSRGGQDAPAPFAKELSDLMERLMTALKNHLRITQHKHDPEMTADLYFETSLGYNDSPDLRITWLANMANKHEQLGNFEEAAVCKVNIAALVCAYLRKLKPAEAIPVEHSVFRCAAPNIRSRFKIPKIDSEGVCTSSQFTRDGLFNELLAAAEALRKNNMFESAIEVYKILNGVHQKNKDWETLGSCFGDMYNLCGQIKLANEGKSRLFSKFYRVGFFGKRSLAHYHGKEYIYKEQAFVRVADMSRKMKEQFEMVCGAGTVEILGNKPVDESALDKAKTYIQIVECKPQLTEEERALRKNEFERQFNIRRFVFDTPFVKEGGKMGNMCDQYVRKTVLTVDRPFPDVLKRHLVIKKEDTVLTPIQVSIGVIEDRLTAIEDELTSKHPNTKTLQIILQGSVLLQVNAGSLEICEIFLLPDNVAQYDAKHVARLRKLMVKFVRKCKAALKKNEKLIGADQLEFQMRLTEGYIDMRQKVLRIVDPEVLGSEGMVEPEVDAMLQSGVINLEARM